MGCDELIAAIGEAAARLREEILAAAEAEAGALVGRAEAERGGRLETARARGAAAARRESAQVESRARIGAKREVLAARYEVIERALAGLEARLRALGATAQYRPVLEALLGECLAECSGAVVVRCRAEDRGIVEAYAQRHGLALAVEAADFPLGGVETASGPGGACVCRNTFADRIEKIRPQLLQEAGQLLFGTAAREGSP
jgi:vacuolar-type H+-ATPase subunit E/Vma4